MTSVLTPTYGINVVLDQRQLSSVISLVLSVLEVWVCSQRDKCDGSKKQTQHCEGLPQLLYNQVLPVLGPGTHVNRLEWSYGGNQQAQPSQVVEFSRTRLMIFQRQLSQNFHQQRMANCLR